MHNQCKMAGQREPSSIAIASWETEPHCVMPSCLARDHKVNGTRTHQLPRHSPPHIPCQQGADSWWNLSGSCPAKPRHADADEPEALQPSAIQDTPSTSCVGLGAWLEFNNCGKYGMSPRVHTSTIVVTVLIKGSKAPTITVRTKQSMWWDLLPSASSASHSSAVG